jgi:acyl-[acyl-carrier-protein]-phospholipid O-acyltransferase/long-chain-fatty-acid--[acyl-carrier-protein] ligase
MKELFKISGFTPYILIIFLNAMTDLGHKIVLQNTIFKAYSGSELIILTAILNALVLLPFILLFSPSGFLSDKYPKVQIIRVASFIAVLITIAILFAYIMGWFWVAFGLTLLLATQSAIYSPAKYGLIKEMVGNEKLVQANAMVQSITIISILLGAVVYSIFFEALLDNQTDKGEILQAIYPLGFALIGASILEFLLSLKLVKSVKTKTSMRFKPKNYLNLIYLRGNLRVIRKNEIVWLSIIGLAIVWGISQLVVSIFGEYLKEHMGVENTVIAQGLLSVSGVGIVFGSLFVGRVSRRYIETGIIPIGALGVTLSLFFISHLDSLIALGVLFFFYGFFLGFLIVPLNSLIQFATPTRILGKVLAGSNFMQNVSMVTFLILSALFAYLGFSSESLFNLATLIAFLGFLYTLIKLPQSMVRFIVRFTFGLRYKIFIEGLDNIKSNSGVLLLGNHISFLDWAFLQIAYPKQIRFVIERTYYNIWYLKPIFKFFGVIPISSRGGKKALLMVTEALNNGDTVALFPEGHLSRNGHLGQFQRGFELATLQVKNKKAIIVPFYLRGLWESGFSYASEKMQRRKLRDIGVTFGKAMPINSSANEVKNAVFKLSIHSWNDYSKRLPTLPKAWIKEAKEMKNKLAIADSTGVELNGYRFITAVLLMRGAFKKIFGKEQNIGLILPTSAGGAIANMAILTLGKTIVNLNYTSGNKSLKYAIKLADIKYIVTSKKFLNRLKAKGFDLDEVLEEVEVIILEELKAKINNKALQISTFLMARVFPAWLLDTLFIKNIKPTDTTAILFSSGSEGNPKGVELSHINIMGNIKQIATVLNPTDEDVMLGTLPIFHSFGLTVSTLFPLIEGVPVVCHPDPTDGYNIAKLSLKYKATLLFATATFYRLYARNRKIHPLMFESLRMVIAGAEKLPKEVSELFKKRFGKTILEGYGTTETTPVASCNLHDAIDPSDFHIQVGNKEGTIGLPLPGTSFIIVNPDTFEPLPTGEDGMMLIGGTQIMKGYLKDKERTKSVIKEIDGIRWYISGDKGHIDEDGFITIVDRYSRFAKIGGEMVSLGLVEQEIGKLIDEDSQIAITALPDSKKGERLVLLLEGEKEIEELKKDIKELKINPLYIPSIYIKVVEIPKLGTGKSDFKGIKKLAMELTLS